MIELTAQQERFCQEYIIDLNATQSAIRAGYSVKTADVQGCRLLGNVKVQARIAELNSERIERVQTKADYVLNRLLEIDSLDVADILDDRGDILPVSQWSKAWRTTIDSFDIISMRSVDGILSTLLKSVRLPNKLRNLELLGKHIDVSAFKERLELTGENGQPLVINVTTPESKSNLETLKEGLKEK